MDRWSYSPRRGDPAPTESRARSVAALVAASILMVGLRTGQPPFAVVQAGESATPIAAADVDLEQGEPTVPGLPSPTPSPLPTATPPVLPMATTTPTTAPTEPAPPTPIPTADVTPEPTADAMPTATAEATPDGNSVVAVGATTEAALPPPSPTPPTDGVAAPPIDADPGDAPALTLRIEAADVAFGIVTATGELDPTVPGLTSSVAGGGAFYVKEGAIRVTIDSNVPWDGACAIHDRPGSAFPATGEGGRLEWRISGTSNWRPIPAAGSPSSPAAACFPDRSTGAHTYVYDLRLRVEPDDPPGQFAATITFAAWRSAPTAADVARPIWVQRVQPEIVPRARVGDPRDRRPRPRRRPEAQPGRRGGATPQGLSPLLPSCHKEAFARVD